MTEKTYFIKLIAAVNLPKSNLGSSLDAFAELGDGGSSESPTATTARLVFDWLHALMSTIVDLQPKNYGVFLAFLLFKPFCVYIMSRPLCATTIAFLKRDHINLHLLLDVWREHLQVK